MFDPMRAIPVAALLFATLSPQAIAAAPAFPVKPVRLVAPYPPGGSSDLIARIVAQKLTERFGQQVLTDNRPGAGGTVGSAIVARSPADGYTLLIGNVAPNAISPNIYRKVEYDTLKDFAPISMLAVGTTALLVHPSVPARTLKELVALARAKPGFLNYGSGGNGTPSHLTGELFNQVAGVNIVHVPYKGTGLSVTGLLAGEVQLVFASTPVAMPHVKSGKLRALAVTSAKRTPLAPDLPTMAEAGVPGVVLDTWWGLLAPARIPAALVERLNRDVQAILAAPDLRERFADLGIDPVGSTPAEFARFIREEFDKYAKLIKAIGLQPE